MKKIKNVIKEGSSIPTSKPRETKIKKQKTRKKRIYRKKTEKKKIRIKYLEFIIPVVIVIVFVVFFVLFKGREEVEQTEERFSKEGFEDFLAIGLYRTQPTPHYIIQVGVRLDTFNGSNTIIVYFVPNSTIINRDDLLNVAGFIFGSVLTGYNEGERVRPDIFESIDIVAVKAMQGYEKELAEFRAEPADIEKFWFAGNLTIEEFKDKIHKKWNID